MPEPITLGTIIAALIAKSVSRAEDGAVETGTKVMRKALSTVRDWFSREDDKEGQQVLESLEGLPDNSALAGALAGVLDERAGRHPELRTQLEALRREAEATGIEIRVNKQTATGNENVQVEAHNSQVNVNQRSTSDPND